MSDCDYSELYEIVLDVIEPQLSGVGFDRKTIKPDTNLMDILDSFGVLDAIMEIEERAGVSADLAQMDFATAMTVSGLAKEIVRINTPM